MSITNQEIASQLREIFQLMQLAGENRFRAIAFDGAAQTIEGLEEDINKYIENDSLSDIKGIGKSIDTDIKAYADTGTTEVLESLRTRIPDWLNKTLDISCLGSRTISKIT